MRYFISRLKIEGFRGINNEACPLDLQFIPDAVNSVFAVNGFGKSSIFEALNYAISGTVPKLEELQSHERPNDYYCNRFHSQGTATVEIELKPDDGTSPNVNILIQRDKSGRRTVTSPSGYPRPEDLLESLNEGFTLLDYRTFINFIDTSPLERGRSFSALLGLEAYSQLRQTLQSVSDARVINSDIGITSVSSEITRAEQEAQAAFQKLSSSFHGVSGKQLVNSAMIDDCVVEVLTVFSCIDLLKEYFEGKRLDQVDFSVIKSAIRSAEGGEKQKEFEKVLEKITELTMLSLLKESFSDEQFKFRQLVQEKTELMGATRGDVFKKLYETAKTLIERGEWKEPRRCPLCESELKNAIGDVVEKQIDQYSQVAAKASEIKIAWSSAAWVRRLQILEQTTELNVNEETKVFNLLSRKITSSGIKIEEVETAIALLNTLEETLEKKLFLAKTRRDEIQMELPPSLVRLTEQVEFGRVFGEALYEYIEKKTIQDKAKAKLHFYERWQCYISKVSDVFAKAEAELSRRRLSVIDTEYKTIFAQIMAVDDVMPELERAEHREHLHVQLSNFYGQKSVSARALLSESFRNALAISVFLSAALKQSGVPRFIVLDDITSSFDSGHQWNLMEVIRRSLQYSKNSNGLQFIILSHDGLLEKYFDKLGNTTDWHHQKLQGCPPKGAIFSQHQVRNRLYATAINLLNNGQVKEAEPLIRQYLEFKLLQIINKVNIPVPLDFSIKGHMKMVSNCLDAIDTAISLYKRASSIVLTPAQLNAIDSIHVPALIANWVSHYETGSGSSLSPSILKSVLKTIDDFAECFQYDQTVNGGVQKHWYKSLSKR